MSSITRRVFLKATAVIGTTLAVGRYLASGKLNLAEFVKSAEASQEKAGKMVNVVSDVDAHSQCQMRAIVKV